MHRSIDISVPAGQSQQLVAQLKDLDGVVTLSVHVGDAIKPAGDVISLVALNTAEDDVLSLVDDLHTGDEHAAVVTSTVDTLLFEPDQQAVHEDHDETAWEEAETALRRHTRPNLNFFLTSALGAVLAVCAFTSSSELTQAVALVAAGIIAPSFEPLGRLALSLVTRHRDTMVRALVATAFAYLTILAVAVLTFVLLRAIGGHHFLHDVLSNRTYYEVQHPPAITLVISGAGALAGVVMIASGRMTALPGALVALQLLPALSAVGIALESGHGTQALQSLGRFGIDVGMVLLFGLIFFTYKHIVVHSRRPAMH